MLQEPEITYLVVARLSRMSHSGPDISISSPSMVAHTMPEASLFIPRAVSHGIESGIQAREIRLSLRALREAACTRIVTQVLCFQFPFARGLESLLMSLGVILDLVAPARGASSVFCPSSDCSCCGFRRAARSFPTTLCIIKAAAPRRLLLGRDSGHCQYPTESC